MSVLVATVFGNGPFTPVISYNKRLYVLGPQFEDMEEALGEAIRAVEQVRATMRHPGFDEILADLPA